MGIINGGMHGKVRKKVGGVVYRVNRGLNTVSEYQPNIHDAKSEAQLIQRLRFKNLVKFLKWFGPEYFQLAFKFAKNKLCGWTNAIKLNMQAVNDDGSIDMTKTKMSVNNDPFRPTVVATYNRFLDRCEINVVNQDTFINRAKGIVSIIINSFRPGQNSNNPNDDEWVDFYWQDNTGWVCEWYENERPHIDYYANDLGTGLLYWIDRYDCREIYNPDDPNIDSYPLNKFANSVVIADRAHNNYAKPVKLFTAEVKTKVR